MSNLLIKLKVQSVIQVQIVVEVVVTIQILTKQIHSSTSNNFNNKGQVLSHIKLLINNSSITILIIHTIINNSNNTLYKVINSLRFIKARV